MSSQCEIHFGIAWHPEWDEHKNHQGKVCLLLLFLLYSGVNLVKVCYIRNVKNSTFSLNNGVIIGRAGASPPICTNGMIFLYL